MKTIKSKKLNRQINTICDFNTKPLSASGEETTTGADTTATMTIIITTISTHFGTHKLTA
ncbi:hypothetical protein ABIC45_002928 [Mucilaginibacter rubeus]|uniref:hypothetical protein n=1 Tax=Mucilaginibacter rubeus TaxID=2027860 RepID=UPI0033920827